MVWLKAKFPVFFSPRFWSVILTGFLAYLNHAGVYADPELGEVLQNTTGAATAVGVLQWLVKTYKKAA